MKNHGLWKVVTYSESKVAKNIWLSIIVEYSEGLVGKTDVPIWKKSEQLILQNCIIFFVRDRC